MKLFYYFDLIIDFVDIFVDYVFVDLVLLVHFYLLYIIFAGFELFVGLEVFDLLFALVVVV